MRLAASLNENKVNISTADIFETLEINLCCKKHRCEKKNIKTCFISDIKNIKTFPLLNIVNLTTLLVLPR